MGDADPHEVLGIRRNASQEEVRDAYRRMVKKHHPDVSDAPDAEKRFVRIRDAYEEMYEDAEGRENKDKEGSKEKATDDTEGSYTSQSGGVGPQDFSSSENVYRGSGSYEHTASSTSAGSSSTERTGGEDYRTWREEKTKKDKRKGRKRTRNHHEDDGERVEGLRGGWEILRGLIDGGEEVNWFVHRPRDGYYLDGDAKRTRSRHGFGSRSNARKAYKKYRRSDDRSSPGVSSSRGHGFQVIEKLDDMWRLARGPKGFVVVSQGHPLTFLDDSGNVAIRSRWFSTEKKARDAHERRNQRAKPSMSRRTRILLAPFLIPFFATLAVLGAVSSSDTSSNSYSVYISGTLSTTFLMVLAYTTRSFLIAGFAAVNLILLCVLLLSPYDLPDE